MHPIENIIETSMQQIKRMTEVNTVIGTPVDTGGGTVLLPVSKVTLGFVVGGGEYGSPSGTSPKHCGGAEADRFPFAGESTVGMSLKPLAFVTVEQGNVRVLPASPAGAVDKLTDFVPQMLKTLDRFASALIDKLNKKCENREKAHAVRETGGCFGEDLFEAEETE